MSILNDLARTQLWGAGNMKKRPSLIRGLIGDFQYFVLGNKDERLPSAFQLIDWWIEKTIREWLTGPIEPDRLPDGFPAKVYDAIDSVINARGGYADKEAQRPNYWLQRNKCTVTPFAYVLPVSYELSADPGKVGNWETSFEDRLSGAGYDLNVRIALRPLRIEIDKPNPPMISLSAYWEEIADLPINESLTIPGVTLQAGNVGLMRYALTNDKLSNLVAGSPGSGKTQLTLGMILSLCYLNSPEHLSLMIVDPKVVDWLPLSGLPHLSAPIAQTGEQALVLIDAMVEEMEDRMLQASKGLRVAQMKPVILYVDEMADLVAGLPKAQADRVALGFQRLSQTGRGLRLGIIGATQRVYDLDAAMYSKLNGRFVGRTQNANDGVAASGVSGVTTHKLPGKGAFEFYPGGERLQGFFVADPDRDDYPDQLRRFSDDIAQRWAGAVPHWTPWPVGVDGSEDGQGPQLDPFMELALAAYLQDPQGFTQSQLRRLYERETGKSTNSDIARRLWTDLMDYGRAKFNRAE